MSNRCNSGQKLIDEEGMVLEYSLLLVFCSLVLLSNCLLNVFTPIYLDCSQSWSEKCFICLFWFSLFCLGAFLGF